MNSQTIAEPPKASRKTKTAIVICVTLMSMVIFGAVVAYCYNYYPDSITPGVEFTMRVGDRRVVNGSDNLVLELSRIDDSTRCAPRDEAACVWEGEINYVFRVDNEEIIVGSVLDARKGEDVKGYNIRYVLGDEKYGVFILQKNEK